ncbi:metal ABC transporter permease [Sediminitomix flava]|uniref:Manganese/zinc/iron transport system permease protein n=1 Tax=Sediminitomix flava TaxID=379075 RepID=A0A315Z6R2_SEDFL|nr:metal ABC transporter permease [Sediminitomix flava]PWJ40063.1 manganese/zinc/iron transport system permease protein [Sediminitomix flava]
MNSFIEDFILLGDANVRWVLLAVLLMSSSTSIVGCLSFLRKRALIGDAVSHAILPGICLSFLLTQSKDPVYLMVGAVITGSLSIWCIDFIVSHTKLKPDTALALILSVFYGIGIVLLTHIQTLGMAGQSGLDKFLFGKAASMVASDVRLFSTTSLIIILTVVFGFSAFRMVIFDRGYATSVGLPVKKIELLITFLTVLAIATGIQAIGVVLMSAMLITPAAAARYWTHSLSKMMIIAVIIAGISAYLGTLVSYIQPKMPTGPWVVVFLTFLAFISIIFGAKRGRLFSVYRRLQNKRRIQDENVLKSFYHLKESKEEFRSFTASELVEKTGYTRLKVKASINRLVASNLVKRDKHFISVTETGIEESKRLVRIHRLWELYITKYMNLPADHVHDDAEAIEHIITPELEQALIKELGRPEVDPHNTPIPYKAQ